MLNTAKAEAADRIESAEREAKLFLDRVNEEIPELVRAKREERLKRIEEESTDLASRLIDEEKSTESIIRSRKPMAVQALLSALFEKKE